MDARKGHGKTFLTVSLLAALLIAGALVNCSGPAETSTSLLNRGVGPEPESLDPHHTRTTQAHTVQRDLFEGLVGYSPDGELVAAAAERWEMSDDGLRHTFWLRPDAKWSNGEPLTANDFVFSFRRLVDPATAAFYSELLIAVENASEIIEGTLPPESLGVRAVDTQQLEIVLDYPVPYFVGQLALPAAYPVSESNIVEFGDNFARAGQLISNGAYALQDWKLGSYIELQRNPRYWNDAATRIDRVRHHITIEPNAELYRYRSGELDVTAVVPAEAYAQVLQERPEELRVAPFLGVYFYGFNLKQEWLRDNPALRRALSMAIDRDVLTDKVTARGEQPAYSWVPPGIINYDPQQLAYADLSRDARHTAARRAYKEAGFSADKPLEIEIRYNTGDSHERIALAIQSMWREVLGVETRLVNEEFRVLVANIRAMEITEIFRLSWNGDYNDAHSFLTIFETRNASNLTGYANPYFDSLMQRAAQQTDPQSRRLFLEEAEQVMLADHPVIPLYYRVSKHLVHTRVTGWQDNVLDFHYSQHLGLRERNKPE